MNKKFLGIGIVAVLLAVILGGGCSTYNELVTLEQEVDATWAKVEVQYQRRLDLIPNLVETVKGYAAHESNTLESVTRARAGLNAADSLQNSVAAGNAQAFDSYNAAQSRLNSALSLYVNAVREAYPDLKANENFKDLQTQLEGTENRIATERGRYTEVVKDYTCRCDASPAISWQDFSASAPNPSSRPMPLRNRLLKCSFKTLPKK